MFCARFIVILIIKRITNTEMNSPPLAVVFRFLDTRQNPDFDKKLPITNKKSTKSDKNKERYCYSRLV